MMQKAVIPIVIDQNFTMHPQSAQSMSRYVNLSSLQTEYSYWLLCLDTAKIARFINIARESNLEFAQHLLE